MHTMKNRDNVRNAGFTLTELLVLVGVGALLSGVLLADFSQTRSELLRDACAANMKQWGLAFRMYANDYNGTFYYDSAGGGFDDATAPLRSYIAGSNIVGSNLSTTIRTLRVCPSRLGQVNLFGSAYVHSYSMPIGLVHYKGGFIAANSSVSPFYGNSIAPYWPNLKWVTQPAQYLLLFESNGNTLQCGGLVGAVSTGTSADPLPAIDRHGGAVNCLFGDFHVEFVSAQTLTNQDAMGCDYPQPDPWFVLN
ncbi:MAG: hypothetical protein ABSA12_09025 [Verrucomicrobiia bacterium]